MKNIRWICVNYTLGKTPFYAEETISFTRKRSIEKLIHGTNDTWQYWREKIGWQCKKIEITYTEI